MILNAAECREYLRAKREEVTLYGADIAVKHAMASANVLVLAGAVAVGKDTAKQKFVALSGQNDMRRIHPVMGGTSRPPRSGERVKGGDTYLNHWNIALPTVRRRLDEALARGWFVQAELHPTTDELYATMLRSYDTDPEVLNVADLTAIACKHLVVANTIPGMRIAHLVPYSVPEWERRWALRDGDSPAQQVEYLTEAQQSLTICLNEDGQGVDATFVPNLYDYQVHHRLAKVANGTYPADLDDEGRKCARLFLVRVSERLESLPDLLTESVMAE